MNSKGSFIRTHFPFYELALKLENNFIFYEVTRLDHLTSGWCWWWWCHTRCCPGAPGVSRL